MELIGIVQTVVGGLIAAIAGLVALGVGKRNEHDKWLREQRVSAYVRYLAHMDELFSISQTIQSSKAEMEEWVDRRSYLSEQIQGAALGSSSLSRGALEEMEEEIVELESRFADARQKVDVRDGRLDALLEETYSLLSSIELLGPDGLAHLVSSLQKSLREGDSSAVLQARSDFARQVKRILKTMK